MSHLSAAEQQIQYVNNFDALVATPFTAATNAICWARNLSGDFSEIVAKATLKENITVLDIETLDALELSEQGQLARRIIINDLLLLKAHGAMPSLNLIKCYERDDAGAFFATDVYSFHADRSDIPSDTFLCTYYGSSSEILPNTQARQKILVPEIRAQLKQLYDGPEEGFESFLSDNFFDLHYQPIPGAQPISLGNGHVWRLAIDYPNSPALPCIHRAPEEKNGQTRLLLIC